MACKVSSNVVRYWQSIRAWHTLAPQLRKISTRHIRAVSTTQPDLKDEKVEVTFVKPNGERIKGYGKVGDSLLDIVISNDIDIDGYGACEGTLTCSTCHLILRKEDYDKLPEKPTDEEMDMLDLAYDLTDTSRLGCQIIMSKELSGMEVKVPENVNDARS